MSWTRFAPLAVVGLAACGGRTVTESDAGMQDTATPGACMWSPSFEPIDATPMMDSCRASRHFIRCDGSDGSSAFCVTDKDACDTLPIHPPTVTYTCSSMCKPSEFGATCGTIMGTSVNPPADCRSFPSPGGIFYCCACTF